MKTDPFAPIGGDPSPQKNKPLWSAVTPVPSDAPPAPEQHPRLGKPAGRWIYRDQNGELLGYVNRFNQQDGKQFRPLVLFSPEAGGVPQWRWESWPAPRPLYGLDRLAGSRLAPVIVCEGEKSADAAGRLAPDHAATTSPNGSKSAAKADWRPLRGRKVIIWPDADKPGGEFAEMVAGLARDAGAISVSIITPPDGAPEGWDAADAEHDGWTISQTAALINAAVPFAQAEAQFSSSSDMPGRKRAPAQRDSLMRLTEFCDLWHSRDGEGFITIPVQGHRENWPIRSRQLKNWLSARAFEEMGIAPGAQAIEDTLRVLEARAVNEGEARTPWMRTGQRDGRIYIDLCDAAWRAVEVSQNGWQLIERHTLPFIRSSSMRALPEPEAGESIDLLRQFVNTAREADFMLSVAWLLAALAGRGPFPILMVQGEQGTGKSTFARILRALVDPNGAPHRQLPRDIRDFAVAAANALVLSFDNISSIDPEISDMLCRAATGSGFAARTLHTDRDETIINLSNPIILNGIPALSERADLADRTITIHLKPIAASDRQTEAELWENWAASAPRVLGALLDGLSAGLRNLASTHLPEKPRLADFALWVTACEAGLGWEPGSFMAEYMDNRRTAADSAFESDPIAVAIHELAKRHSASGWHGSPTELLDALNMQASEAVKRARAWPVTAQGLGNRLERAAPLLRARGVHFQRKHSGTRTYTIWTERPETGAPGP
ncbi:MAG: ATP-binding protein [Beijerinckiaceae bacterium]|jgi:putative DNA primase/helicase|nr:ATP-binding protein [Beijerinckiaceae bacterium]